MSWSDLLGVFLLAISGILVGGAFTTFKHSRQLGGVLAVGAVLSGAAGVAWLFT